MDDPSVTSRAFRGRIRFLGRPQQNRIDRHGEEVQHATITRSGKAKQMDMQQTIRDDLEAAAGGGDTGGKWQ
ncbi:hypothetical protein PG993_008521 [Apiospora rasikravindrae]|uniref:Uncharacterized protein n=1 Tax=Apiospora rasikravindrae TaxID=990691 RepID=A0ABR1T0L5_9PEZI